MCIRDSLQPDRDRSCLGRRDLGRGLQRRLRTPPQICGPGQRPAPHRRRAAPPPRRLQPDHLTSQSSSPGAFKSGVAPQPTARQPVPSSGLLQSRKRERRVQAKHRQTPRSEAGNPASSSQPKRTPLAAGCEGSLSSGAPWHDRPTIGRWVLGAPNSRRRSTLVLSLIHI